MHEPVYPMMSRRRGVDLALVAIFSLAYFAATGHLASRKPMWGDELKVYHIAELPTLSSMCEALREQPDAMPPGIHLATWLAGRLFGFSHLAVRLAPMLGFWFMCLSLFLFLRRRVPPLLAAAGMLLPLCTNAYYYAYETRGYGLVLGFCGAALLCWDLTPQPRWRVFALIGLALSMAGAIASHLYAVIFLVPLALAELARSGKRLDKPVWISFAAAWLVLIPLIPLLPSIRLVAGIASGQTAFTDLFGIWGGLLSGAATYLGFLVIVALAAARESPTGDDSLAAAQPGASFSDWVLVAGLAALPLVGFVLAKLSSGLLLHRYVLPAVFGLCMLPVLVCGPLLRKRPRLSLILLSWAAFMAAVHVVGEKRGLVELHDIASGSGPYHLMSLVDRLPDDDLPIVVPDLLHFVALHHYLPSPVRNRLVYIPDYDRWSRQTSEFYEKRYGQRMELLEDFTRAHRDFYLYDPGMNIMSANLLGRGATVEGRGIDASGNVFPRPGSLFLVSLDRQAGSDPLNPESAAISTTRAPRKSAEPEDLPVSPHGSAPIAPIASHQ